MATRSLESKVTYTDAPIIQKLFNSTTWAILWLVVRVYVGYQWLHAGLEKIESPAWMATGEALKGFWVKAVAVPAAPARPAIAYDWYRIFLQGMLDSGSYVWFAKLVAVGEVLIGIGLIVGMFTAVAAFFGGFMNWNFMMAGSASTNPVLFLLAILLILAWKTAGYYGLDRFVMPLIGTPWQPGKAFKAQVKP